MNCHIYAPGKASGREEYYDKAVKIYQWEKENLFGPTGAVFDAYDLETGINQWCSTYNQGTFIGAATLLYQFYGEEAYLQDAKLAADYTVNTMFSGQVMNTEGEGNDLPGFKGILARWMGKFVRACGEEQYTDWLRQNALTAWNNRNSKGIMWTQFNMKTEDAFYSAWGCSAAVSMLINCPYEIE
jgi:predicted alpha-1,6-mannanase (GH76 family)